jgi:hypothetical protein
MTDEYQPSITYRNLEDEVIPAPVPVFRPTKNKPEPDKDDFIYADTRRVKRAKKRARARQAKVMQRAYVRREWAKETEANQLAQLFNLADGLVPASGIMHGRARSAILDRIKHVRDEDQRRYDKEWAARKKDRDLPAPQPVIAHEIVEQRLRGIAKTARTVVPR